MLQPLWALVLAGGAGRRLAGLTGGVPKQFWSPGGRTSLLEDTLERLAALARPRRRVTVVDASHRPYLETIRDRPALGGVLFQPADRGTAAGVILGLTAVLAHDADALVLITPADHGVERRDEFTRGILAAADHVRAGGSDIVLFGAEPARAADDLGWITPRRHVDAAGRPRQFVPVARFAEKPGALEAARLFAAGSVWNTMVLVGRASAVFDACRQHVPEVTQAFARLRARSSTSVSRRLDEVYQTLPSADFSRDVLGRARGLALYTWPRRMGWSDLGTPDRVRAWRDACHPLSTPNRRTPEVRIDPSLPAAAAS